MLTERDHKVGRLTSLLLVEERLIEAEFFNLQLKNARGLELQFFLNAYLSAARAVTFLIQKELRHVASFESYWSTVQSELRNDDDARFFLELRNFSQKSGRVAITSLGGFFNSPEYGFPSVLGERPPFLHFFADGIIPIPTTLKKTDVVTSCAKHTGKLAHLTLKILKEFPFDTCPNNACTPSGARHHGLSLADFVELAGLPREWVAASSGLTEEQAYSVLSRYFDPVDTAAIERIAKYSDIQTN